MEETKKQEILEALYEQAKEFYTWRQLCTRGEETEGKNMDEDELKTYKKYMTNIEYAQKLEEIRDKEMDWLEKDIDEE